MSDEKLNVAALLSGEASESEDKTRLRIITYAHRIFLERGFRKITVEELCAGMALSKRTFYKYFKNRDDLVLAILQEVVRTRFSKVFFNLNSDQPVRQVILRHFQLLQEEAFQNISLVFLSDVQDLMPELWEFIDQVRAQVALGLGRLIERGQREGAIRREIDPEVFGKIIEAFLLRVADPRYVMTLGLNLQQVAGTMRELIMHGVMVPEEEGGR
ncbi:MAG: TetR/AcrR family transcriptional regulator [Myxococcales bacterium]|nr:TetR/AcrR family transcriptional regulator [Myxococcales bacterium]